MLFCTQSFCLSEAEEVLFSCVCHQQPVLIIDVQFPGQCDRSRDLSFFCFERPLSTFVFPLWWQCWMSPFVPQNCLYLQAVIKCLCWQIIWLFIMWGRVMTCPLACAVVMLVIHAYNHPAAVISQMVNNNMTLGWWSGGIYCVIATLQGLTWDRILDLGRGLRGGGRLCNIIFVVWREGRGLFNGQGNGH